MDSELQMTVHSHVGSVKVALPRDATVAVLKVSLSRSTDVAPMRQTLLCRGRILSDNDPVEPFIGHIVHMHISGR